MLGSLRPTRDYTYVADTVEAFVRVAESDQSVGQIINIGSNFEISIGDIAQKVMAISCMNKEIRFDDRRARPQMSEVERLWCDNSKAKRVLGWQPKLTFEEGLARTIEWISAHQSLYRANLYNV
jgi:nucleoside-diphosphate-sugar epimerase